MFESPHLEETFYQQQSPLKTVDVFHLYPRERQEDILEIVGCCVGCVERYFKDFDIPKIPSDNFFVYTKDSMPPPDNTNEGLYYSEHHMFGVREDALYKPKVYIHEMLHFVAKELHPGSENTGYQFLVKEAGSAQPQLHSFYSAINEGMTDLMTEELYSISYKKLKDLFRGRGGIEQFVSRYSDYIIFIQKLIEYHAIILKKETGLPEEEAHARVWSKLKRGYLTNDTEYFEQLCVIFANSANEHKETVSFIQQIQTSTHPEAIGSLIFTLKEKIDTIRK